MKQTIEKAQPWKRQRRLKKEDIPLQAEVIQVARGYTDLIERSLYVMCYLTAGRISELVRLPYLIRYDYTTKKDHQNNYIIAGKEKIKHDYPGVLKKNIIFTNIKGKNIMVVSMENRKNRKITRKSLPIPIEKEAPFINMLKEYLNTLEDDAPLFPFGTGKARKIIAKCGMNPHFLRDIRLTHMITLYHFDTFQLVKFAGWTNINPAERYVRLSITDLVDKY